MVGAKDVIDTMYAREWMLVDEITFIASYDVDGPEDDTWWLNESFEEHFGSTKAKILMIVLA